MKEITLTQGKVALVDDGDFPLVNSRKWYAHLSKGKWYAANKDWKRPMIFLHRLLLGCSEGEYVDHINGDGLDNRRENLRVATQQQNCHNQRKQAGRSSIYKGVSLDKRHNTWKAYIHTDKYQHLGDYTFQTEAALAYDRAAIKNFGEFARLNFPRGRATPGKPTFLFVGHGRTGKDTSAEMFAGLTGLRYAGSFSWAGLPFMADFLKLHPAVAWENRHQHRQAWKDRLDFLRVGDETFLAELALASGEVAAGLRDKKEIEAVKSAKLFTRIFWVERPGTPVDPTVTFGPENCDEVIHNDGGLIHLHSKLFLIAERLGLIPDLYLSGKVRITTDQFRD